MRASTVVVWSRAWTAARAGSTLASPPSWTFGHWPAPRPRRPRSMRALLGVWSRAWTATRAGRRDVRVTDPYWPWIEALYDAGLTQGCATGSPPRYCPDGVVSRAQMAVFL